MLYPACIFVCDRFGSQHMMPKLWSRHPRLEPTPEPSGGKIQWKLGLDFIDAEMKKRLKKGPTWTAASRGSSELTRWYLTPIAHSVTYQHGKPKFISQEVHVGVKLYKDHRLTMPEVLEMLESCKRTGPARTSESRSLGLSPPGKTHIGNPRKSSWYDRDLY